MPDQVFLTRKPLEARWRTMSRLTTRRSELRRRLRATGGRGRKLRGLASLLAPYRWRVVAMVASVVVATAAALAPAPLAKLAIDNGISSHDSARST